MKLLSGNLSSAKRQITIRNHEIYSRGTIVINTLFITIKIIVAFNFQDVAFFS